MKERGIIMGADSVRGILAGTKTQTRRIAKPQYAYATELDGVTRDSMLRHCRFQVGGRLWVKETWAFDIYSNDDNRVNLLWRATDPKMGHAPEHWVDLPNGSESWLERQLAKQGKLDRAGFPVWDSPLYLPRWASRLTLEIIAVSVERLQDITEDDAKAEGMTIEPQQGTVNGEPAKLYPMTYRQAFIWHWDALNAKRGFPWRDSPWCWVIEFKRIDATGTSPQPDKPPPAGKPPFLGRPQAE